jgi:hypothetical protein
VGFNANRRYRDDKRNDIVLLVSAAVIVVGLLLWATGIVG